MLGSGGSVLTIRLCSVQSIDTIDTQLKQRENALLSTENQDPAQSPQSVQVAVAFIGPTLIALAIAALWYHFNT